MDGWSCAHFQQPPIVISPLWRKVLGRKMPPEAKLALAGISMCSKKMSRHSIYGTGLLRGLEKFLCELKTLIWPINE